MVFQDSLYKTQWYVITTRFFINSALVLLNLFINWVSIID